MNDIDKNKALFEKELRSTAREGIDFLLEAIEKCRFYEVGGEGGHDRERGGTLNHSLWVLYLAREELSKHPDHHPGVNECSLILVCLLHDLGNTSPRIAFPRYTGHGARSALIIDSVRRHRGLDISDEELAVIRFHRGHHIRTDLDRTLDRYYNSPLLKLLRYADWTAAGIVNCMPFGISRVQYLLDDRSSTQIEVSYDPQSKYWYFSSLNQPSAGVVDIKSLETKKEVSLCYSIIFYGFGAYDVLFARDERGMIGVMTSVEYRCDRGALYRTDGRGFGYKRAVLFVNSFGYNAPANYVAVENRSGEWSVIEIKRNRNSVIGAYCEFHERHLIASNCQSENGALYAVKHRHHGVDLKNGYFIRIEV